MNIVDIDPEDVAIDDKKHDLYADELQTRWKVKPLK